MSSVSDRNRRITFSVVEREELRTTLIACFRADARYRNKIQCDLRPLWRAAEASLVEEERGWPRFANIDRVDVAAYVEALRQFVGQRMRLTQGGEPADWALGEVHASVVGGQTHRIVGFTFRHHHATITLDVTPAGARVEVRDDHGAVFAEKKLATVGYDFDRWAELEAFARDHLTEQVARLRREFEQRYPESSYPRRNRSDLQRWHSVAVPALVKLLFHGKQTAKPSRKTLKRLADRIGIDLPVA